MTDATGDAAPCRSGESWRLARYPVTHTSPSKGSPAEALLTRPSLYRRTRRIRCLQQRQRVGRAREKHVRTGSIADTDARRHRQQRARRQHAHPRLDRHRLGRRRHRRRPCPPGHRRDHPGHTGTGRGRAEAHGQGDQDAPAVRAAGLRSSAAHGCRRRRAGDGAHHWPGNGVRCLVETLSRRR